jgi:hypothetical protein
MGELMFPRVVVQMLDQAVKKLLEPASRLGLEGALHRIRDRELIDIPHLFSSPSPRFPRGEHFSLDGTVGRASIFGKRKSFRIAKKRAIMRIGKQDNAFTAIATSDATSVTVRGHDLCDDLIGKINFTDYFWLLVLGEKPTEAQRDMMDACLVAIAEHGLVPSVQAARMTLAAGPDAWQGAMSAGLLGMGSVVAGSSESAGRYLAEVIAKAEADGTDIETAAIASLKEHKALRAQGRGSRPSAAFGRRPEGRPASGHRRRSRHFGQVHRDPAHPRPARARDHRAAPADQCLGRDPGLHPRRGLAARSHQGGAAPGARGGPVGASLRGIPALHRVHHVPQGGRGHRL